MKILFLNYEYPPLGGGAANATRYLLDTYKDKKNISVDLVTTAADNRERTEDLGGGIRIHYVAIAKNRKMLTHQSLRDLLMYTWKGYRKASALMRAQNYDIIHAFFGVPCGWMARRLSRHFGVPYIISLRGADVPGFSDRYDHIYPFLKPVITGVWRDATRVVANSARLRDLAHKSAPMQEIDIIYNGIDTTRFTPGDVSQKDDNTFVVLTAARLMRRKGIRFLIDAFAQLRDARPHILMKMIIAGGDGDAADALRAQVQKLGLGKVVFFTGHLDQDALITAYQRADVFVLPSLNEGMSNNMLEALACGLPIIITRTGGSEIITDGKEGFLVDREDAGAIRSALDRFIRKPTLLATMGTASRALAQKMSWHSVADRYEELYYKYYKKH